ncbi:hypothetical protein [Azohydromonas aeria]|nr:hypothetical protein [Azohydromonas aeria]
MKSYVIALAISLAVANNIGTALGAAVNSMYSDLVVKLERVQGMVR